LCCGLWPSFAYEVSRTEEAAERRRTHSADHAGLEVEENRAWYLRAARDLVTEHVDDVEMCVVVAKVVWHGNKEMQLARAHVFRIGKLSCFNKASAATLSQQEVNESADLQRGRAIYPAFLAQL
jgi:hypothetical protein